MSLSRSCCALAALFIAFLPYPSHADVEAIEAKINALKVRVGVEHRRLAYYTGRWERLLLECSPGEVRYESRMYDRLRRLVPLIGKDPVHQALSAYAEGIQSPVSADKCAELVQAGEVMTGAMRVSIVTGEALTSAYNEASDAIERRKGQ